MQEWILWLSFVILTLLCNSRDIMLNPQKLAQNCNTHDRESLVSFKSHIKLDTTGILSSWIGSDCCSGGWEGIQCDSINGRVISVQLHTQSVDNMFMIGTLSPYLGNLTFLENLVISGMKRITGTIPESLLTLNKLTQLNLEDNSLYGKIPFNLLTKLPNLQILSLNGNHLSGQIPISINSNHSSLVQINLARNFLTGPIPSSFKYLRGLQFIDLSQNLLSGIIPDFIGTLLNLSYIDLSNNNLSGRIPVSISDSPNIAYIELSRNRLTGGIPSSIGKLTKLTKLSLGFNHLTGQIPKSILVLKDLWNLSLTANGLSGPLLNNVRNTLLSLASIDLSYNNFILGTVPEWILRRNVAEVRLSRCGLKGTLPVFSEPDSLVTVDLADNHFTDGIVKFFANASSVQNLNISNNLLKCDVSAIKFPEQMTSLDIHANQLSGILSIVLNGKKNRFLETIDVSNNQMSGQIPEFTDEGPLKLKVVNIGSNNVTGGIPNSISKLVELERLDVSRNKMTGGIPESLGQLSKLHWLELSNNGFCGKIPDSLLRLKALKHANFRANRLCGQIPQGRPFSIFPMSAFRHNDCLCGIPLPPCTGKNNQNGKN